MTHLGNDVHTIDNSEENPALLSQWSFWCLGTVTRLQGIVSNHPKQPRFSPEAHVITTAVTDGTVDFKEGTVFHTKNTWYKLGVPA